MIARVNEVPASCAKLERAAIEAALVKACGNITATAKKLRVPSSDLRRLVRSSSLADVVYEQVEQTFDQALQVLFDGLKSPDPAHRQLAAKMLLRTEAGRLRGWRLALVKGDDVNWLEH